MKGNDRKPKSVDIFVIFEQNRRYDVLLVLMREIIFFDFYLSFIFVRTHFSGIYFIFLF